MKMDFSPPDDRSNPHSIQLKIISGQEVRAANQRLETGTKNGGSRTPRKDIDDIDWSHLQKGDEQGNCRNEQFCWKTMFWNFLKLKSGTLAVFCQQYDGNI